MIFLMKMEAHIGIFLAWAILNNLEGEIHQEESVEALENLRERRITGRDVLFDECDEKFWDVDLNNFGNALAKEYYGDEGESGAYFTDYIDVLCEGDDQRFYYVEDTWENYDKLAPVISRRFEEWKNK